MACDSKKWEVHEGILHVTCIVNALVLAILNDLRFFKTTKYRINIDDKQSKILKVCGNGNVSYEFRGRSPQIFYLTIP